MTSLDAKDESAIPAAAASATIDARFVAPGDDAPLSIQVEDLHKSFRIPTQKVDSLKERAVRPFSSPDHKELKALRGISFDVRQGEFFGIVGRNGSGKSTLLKILASIYKADSGRIRMAGRLAPFIELGVGFNQELTARENVVLNGVMMGLTPKETRRRLDAVLEFAELEEFVDMKLKNYSSGMLVRLAFSVMMEADADILLVDEVLAVGDAAFQQKCADAFREMKSKGKTLVLVTHDMTTVEKYCHRAMLIDDGHIQQVGEPGEVGRQYMRINFKPGVDIGHDAAPGTSDGVRLHDAWIEDTHGERVTSLEYGDPIRLFAELDVDQDVDGLNTGFSIANADGVGVFEFGTPVEGRNESGVVKAGERVRVRAVLDNPLVPGRYFIHCGVMRGTSGTGGVAMYVHGAVQFVVFGTQSTRGTVFLDHEIAATVGGPDPS